MSTTSERPPFNEAEFLEDMTVGSANLEAPFAQDTVKSIIKAYDKAFDDSAIQVRCGRQANTPLMFRALFAVRVDAMGVALKQNWVEENDPMVQLNRSLDKECPASLDEPEFVVDRGFDGVWKYLGGIFPVDQILAIPDMPDGIQAHLQQFKDFDLTSVVTVQLGIKDRTIDMYFLAKGPLTKKHLTEVIAMAGAPEPSGQCF